MRDQLCRLSIFGIQEADLEIEYLDALRNIPYDKFQTGITKLVSEYKRHRFPLPSEIKEAAFSGTQKEHIDHRYDDMCNVPTELGPDGCSRRNFRPCPRPCICERITGYGLKIIMLAGNFKTDRRRYYLEERMQSGPTADEEKTVLFYQTVADEMKAELGMMAAIEKPTTEQEPIPESEFAF